MRLTLITMNITYVENYNHFDLTEVLASGEDMAKHVNLLKKREIDFITIIDRHRKLGKINTSFIKDLYWIKRIGFDVYDFDVNNLFYIKDTLESISWKLDIEMEGNVLSNFPKLISLQGKLKSIKVINNLPHLRNLGFGKADLKLIDFANFYDLVCLQIGACKNWDKSNIYSLKNLKGLTIAFDRDISNIGFVSDLENLECLLLMYTTNVKKFPNISNLKRLKKIYIYGLNRLEDLSQIRYNENIEEIVILNSDVSASAIEPLRECLNLKRVFWGFKRIGENKKANDWFTPKIDKKIIDEPYYIT